MSSSSAPSPSSRHDAVQLERRDAHRGRVINRSAALQKRREEFAANARPVSPGTSTIYDWTTSHTASPIQLKAFDGAIEDLHDAVSVGNHEVWGDPLPSHLQYRKRDEEPEADTADAHTIAKRGVGGPGSPLPHGEVIQKAFGRHDLSDVKAHLGGHAQEASAALGAEAYATGSDIAFAGTPTLHTAAHEAAHIIQQRAGVSLKDGIGESGDRYERHADEVADAVVRGQSAEGILDRMSGVGNRPQTDTPDIQMLDWSVHAGPFKGGSKGIEAGHEIAASPKPPLRIPVATVPGLIITPSYEVKLLKAFEWPKGDEPWKLTALGVEGAGNFELSYGVPEVVEGYAQSQLIVSGATTLAGRGAKLETIEGLSIALKTALNLGLGLGPDKLVKLEVNLFEFELATLTVTKIENGEVTGVTAGWGKDAKALFDWLKEVAEWVTDPVGTFANRTIVRPITIPLESLQKVGEIATEMAKAIGGVVECAITVPMYDQFLWEYSFVEAPGSGGKGSRLASPSGALNQGHSSLMNRMRSRTGHVLLKGRRREASLADYQALAEAVRAPLSENVDRRTLTSMQEGLTDIIANEDSDEAVKVPQLAVLSWPDYLELMVSRGYLSFGGTDPWNRADEAQREIVNRAVECGGTSLLTRESSIEMAAERSGETSPPTPGGPS